MRQVLRPLSYLYEQIMVARNHLYDRNIFKVHQFDIPIVSVGNLTMGGTGKTPIICELIRWAQSEGLKPAVVSRGYKGQNRSVVKVPAESPDPQFYGDEPAMIALRYPEVPVYVGADRVAVVKQVLAEEKVDLILADDAFQHRRLGRSVDVLIVDASEDLQNYRTLPEGRGRESVSAIHRADFIIVNKCNLVEPEQKRRTLEFVDQALGGKGTPVVESEYYVRKLHRLDGKESVDLGKYEKVLLVSGIGNPRAFEGLLAKNFDVKGHLVFRDHFSFDDQDVRKITDMAKFKDVQRVIVTEKDAVKLRRFSLAQGFFAAELSVKMSLRMKLLYERILQFRR